MRTWPISSPFGRRHRLRHHEDLLGPRRLRRVADRAPFHFGDARRHADDHPRLHPEDVLLDDRLEEVAQHLLGAVEVGDHAVLEGPDRDDAVRRAPQHALRLEPDPLDLAGAALDRHDRGLVQDDPLTLDVHQRIGGAEIDGNLVRGDQVPELPGESHVCWCRGEAAANVMGRLNFYKASKPASQAWSPVLPNPPVPRTLSGRFSTARKAAGSTRPTIICAIRIPRVASNGTAPRFTRATLSSPR